MVILISDFADRQRARMSVFVGLRVCVRTWQQK